MMSESTLCNEDEIINLCLPNLPGYRARPVGGGARASNFTIVDGERFLKENTLPRIGYGLDEGSINTVGALSTHSRLRNQSRGQQERAVLCFQAYYEEVIENGSVDDKHRVRKCSLYYYTENDTFSIVEKPQLNSGIPQGTLLKRQVIAKTDGTQFKANDFSLGNHVNILGQIYHIYDCDAATREYIRIHQFGGDSAGATASQDVPVDYFQQQMDKKTNDLNQWNKYHTKVTDTKKFLEASLGKTLDNKSLKGFLQYGGQTLKFLCLWDNSDSLYGEKQIFSLVYHLSDDTIEIFSKPTAPAMDPIVRFLARSRLPKAVPKLGFGVVPDLEYYSWENLAVGVQISVYGRQFRIVDYDSTTRIFYEENGCFLGDPEPIPKVQEIVYEREIPPPTIFGSDEDSLRSCTGSVLPGPAPIKKLGEDVNLSFTAQLSLSQNVDAEDAGRLFVVTYFVQDGTLSVQEPPVRNSGFQGGAFLSRSLMKDPLGKPFTPAHFYVGAEVTINRRAFVLKDASEQTFRWLEAKNFPRASMARIIEKLRPTLQDAIVSGRLLRKSELDETGHKAREATRVALERVFSEEGVADISGHEIMTIMRAYKTASNTFDYRKFVSELMC